MQTYLEKRQPAKNVARFYRMAVMPNLFGEWTLYREWGRIGQGGQVRMDWFKDENQAVAALVTLETSKTTSVATRHRRRHIHRWCRSTRRRPKPRRLIKSRHLNSAIAPEPSPGGRLSLHRRNDLASQLQIARLCREQHGHSVERHAPLGRLTKIINLALT